LPCVILLLRHSWPTLHCLLSSTLLFPDPSFMSSSLLLLLLTLIFSSSFSTSRLISEDVVIIEEKVDSTPQENGAEETCEVNNNKSLSAIMEKVCEICHDMISDRQPNTRAICRSNCFKNDQFRSCLRLFAPQQTRATRHHHHSN
ncbi:hypothetical protein PMAYCL1PPCAC_17355, partial [Pristionchus mayeri]